MDLVRLTVAVVVVVMLVAGLASASESGGLAGALERQRQDITTLQGEIRRESERQTGSLQQQQDRNLQFQLLLRQQQPLPAPAPLNCAQVSGGLICR
jgi:hypothetical protein